MSFSSSETSFPSAEAIFKIISSVGFCVPLSRRLMPERWIPSRLASSAWEMPCSRRASTSWDMIFCRLRSSSILSPHCFNVNIYDNNLQEGESVEAAKLATHRSGSLLWLPRMGIPSRWHRKSFTSFPRGGGLFSTRQPSGMTAMIALAASRPAVSLSKWR